MITILQIEKGEKGMTLTKKELERFQDDNAGLDELETEELIRDEEFTPEKMKELVNGLGKDEKGNPTEFLTIEVV